MTGSTHKHGHTLDLVLSHGLTICDIKLSDTCFSDHKSVVFEISQPCSVVKPCVAARCLRTVNSETITDFCTAYNYLFSSPNLDCVNLSSQLCADELLSLFNSTSTSILDSVAPL